MNQAQSSIQARAWTIDDAGGPERADGSRALVRAILATLWRHKIKLLVWIVACWALAFVYAQVAPYSYTATATVLIAPTQTPSAAQVETAALGLDIYRAESELEVIRSERLLSTVFEQLKLEEMPTLRVTSALSNLRRFLGLPPATDSAAVAETEEARQEERQRAFEEFSKGLDVRRVGQSYVVAISFTAPEPTLARRVTNAVVSAYIWQSVSAKANAAQSGGEVLQGRLNALFQQAEAALTAVSKGELPDVPISDADARVIGAALQPLEPSAPRKKLIIAFGIILGAASGFFALALAYAFDRKVRTPADIAQALHLPCLAVVPAASKRTRGLHGLDGGSEAADTLASPFAAAIRDLRTAVSAIAPTRNPRGGQCIAFVSWHPGAGSTFLAQTLAHVIGRSGKGVTLIDADMQKTPRRGHEAEERAGSLSEMLMRPSAVPDIVEPDRTGIAFLPAASPDRLTNYLADLASPRMALLIDRACARGDVILDLPPLARSADAKAFARHADAVVLVAWAGRTTTEDLVLAATSLRQLGANVIGAVLNRA